MLSLFRFLYRHIFIVYFLALLLFSWILLLQDNPFQRASFLNSSDAVFAGTYESYDNLVEYLNLREVNEYLSEENSELQDLKLSYYKKSFDNTIVVNDSSFNQEYSFMPAKVIRNSTHQRNNYLSLNRGEKHGIRPGMGVISAQGIVGIVLETSEEFSAVMSVLNSESKLSAKIAKNNYFGSAVWDGKNYRFGQLKDIPNHVSLVEGDLIVSSGFSGIFPESIPLGRVKTVERKAGSGFLEVEFEYTEDYRRLSFVHVVKYLEKEERLNLEAKILGDD